MVSGSDATSRHNARGVFSARKPSAKYKNKFFEIIRHQIWIRITIKYTECHCPHLKTMAGYAVSKLKRYTKISFTKNLKKVNLLFQMSADTTTGDKATLLKETAVASEEE